MHNHSHDELFQDALDRLEGLFADSQQPMYVFLDDELKACNEGFAKLLGYKSPAEWAKVVDDIPRAFVADESIRTVIDSFQAALQEGKAQKVPVAWRKKDGKSVRTNTIFVPFDHDGHRMCLHFIDLA